MSRPSLEHLLTRALVLERQHQYTNRAMIGGMSAFARRLHRSAPADSRLPEIALLLEEYDRQAVPERELAIAQSLQLLDAERPVTAGRNGQGRDKHEPNSATDTPTVRRRATRAPSGSGAASHVAPDDSVQKLPGVGPKLAETLGQVGIHTLRDLLYYFPRDHIDYRHSNRISRLRYGEPTTIVGVIEHVRTRRLRGKLTLTTAAVRDDSATIAVRWFNKPYLEKQLTPGRLIAIAGSAEVFDGRLVFAPRDYEWISEADLTHASRIVPIYPLTKGLYQKPLRSLMRKAVDVASGGLQDVLPDGIREEFGLRPLSSAVAGYHFPADEPDRESAATRLAVDEILAIQLGLQLRKREWQEPGSALALPVSAADRRLFLDTLPFTPTSAQSRVMEAVAENLERTIPMSRLVQGDVGSGKTVIAAFCLFAAWRNGCQAVFMAPTEVLAQQHHRVLQTWLQPLGMDVCVLTGSTPAAARREILERAFSGDADVLVGTHALFQEGVTLARVGAAVVDEQHRFGVEQRTRLRQKGGNPHLLSMTATPIPRTLQLTVYGDLDISVLDELPPGRLPVETSLTPSPEAAYERIESEVDHGRQAFVVCPAIDEGSLDRNTAVEEHRHLQQSVFPSRRIGLLHGRMAPKEKEATLKAFAAGAIQVLVATTVIEVGIDVPNATVMAIKDAHRFGLAQLHQLRGRVGRGGDRSYCLLVSAAPEGPTRERLLAVTRTQDGFALAEEDLRLRGPGEFWGTRQSGIPQLSVAQSAGVGTIELARAIADRVVLSDPELTAPAHADLAGHVRSFWAREADLN